ncbi:hypothetical protein UFOVP901_29 [uncultured Caudovirales phage]|uniref:Uncharacterized protein n=1 Tax=uncultured Caudovirales phage TaxID=2100421 RepID=A0A6J5PDX5_9CAUD|nr:hypothetical protein UFOVP901_29 [uncultured Caudovirales phage]
MTEEQKRKKRNEDLIRRVRAGDSTALIDVMATRFPPRPKIEKNEGAIG